MLDLVSLPVPQSGLSLLAVSTAGHGVRIYDGKHHVDTVKVMEPVSALKVRCIYSALRRAFAAIRTNSREFRIGL